ncbi:glutamate receptor ionotropic, kainate 3-like [Ornithodoros turicata]|uniref:glutamate receptor ionotropic, kainate 3-like n=1 Tax=Ornithodoros turicata TaxID=34597 RepID=UPI0031387184
MEHAVSCLNSTSSRNDQVRELKKKVTLKDRLPCYEIAYQSGARNGPHTRSAMPLRKFENITLRLANVGWYPYIFNVPTKDGNFRLKGITGSMIDYILQSMNMKYVLVEPADRQWGHMDPEGRWTGMMGLLHRHEADLAMGPFVLTEEDASIANPSPPYADEDMVILSGVEKEHKSNVYGYVSAFDVNVWMMLLCFVGFVAFVAVIIECIMPDPSLTKRQRQQRLSRIFWTYVASVCLESSNLTFTSNPHRVLFGTWFFMIVILMNTFVAYMESAMMLKEETDRLDTIEDLAKTSGIVPMVFEAAGFLEVIQDAEGYAFQKVLKMMEQEEQQEEVHGEELFTPPYLEMVLKRKAAILMERISLLARVTEHCYDKELKGLGLFHLGRKRIIQIKMVFYLRKDLNPELQEEIFKRVRWIMDSGLNLHWHEDLVPDPGPCWTQEHADHLHDYDALDYADFAVIFYLLLTSHGLAFCGYFLELFVHRYWCINSRTADSFFG